MARRPACRAGGRRASIGPGLIQRFGRKNWFARQGFGGAGQVYRFYDSITSWRAGRHQSPRPHVLATRDALLVAGTEHLAAMSPAGSRVPL